MVTQRSLSTKLIESMQNYSGLLAIQDQAKTLTYAALQAAVLNCVEVLQQAGVKKGARLLIVGEKNCDMLVVILACLFSDIVYIPIEQPMPETRIHTIATDTQANARFDIGSGLTLFNTCTATPTDDILIFYTSGSTGKPKGVRISEINILNFVIWAQQTFNISCNDRFAAFAPWHFDLSILDIYAALLTGASIHCVPAMLKPFPYQMTQWLNQQQISIIYIVPTAIRHLIKHGKWTQATHSSLRCILFAGEPYPLSELKELRSAFDQPIIANLYGPTETNVCTWYKIPALVSLLEWTEVPIGHALPNFNLYVWGENNNLLNNIGDEGELICVGSAVSPGYINDRDSLKFFNYGDQHAYRTGDWVRITQHGLVFLGRQDRQVKLFGYRIDLQEIEACIRQHPAVIDAAVCVHQKELIAFIIGNNEFSVKSLSAHCLHNLPSYYCPKRFIQIETLPLTLSEKIDYQQLLANAYAVAA